ncbi:uncharacterized protein L969DRAFT_48536 [Mixia osmundae IAM 14324]|uniref:RNA helicase n=1 Tax=Mixia osmundae (strain CBS 9802 / IAM 14324 / JCM 22182 / KY 12970) TaxID=764103 RepID=G7DZU1_MIXOS|nr:uncharacterized protein L969DRAFT_48536 [Mixia osmundae IAM 14324]KEI39239.1 hypothetical protein L969DRAFT_48536 [Mixia osmundae IAM 14324]GAA96101.1 hypothetical protein E5Q_02762 [Mixia osmundae IAM 14324]
MARAASKTDRPLKKMKTRHDKPGKRAASSDDGDSQVEEVSATFAAGQQRPHSPLHSLATLDGGIEDDDDFVQALMGKQNAKASAQVGKALKIPQIKKAPGQGSFQSMGIQPNLLKTILMRGFHTPTPIQRAALPSILATPPRDLVGMARTGSGKTLAYMIPLIQRLGGQHSQKFGARALVMVPTRELALQVLKVGKDLSRGLKEGDSETLRWGLIIGGDGLEEQFGLMASNPDVIIATPGRLLHLIVEMDLDMSSVAYAVFDEADRLFEMGFATQLHEILHRLPPSRQTLLFSATLPTSLVEFARAGLQNPKLVRLDADTKISSDLQMAMLSVKPTEKEAALLLLLRDVIGVPQSLNRQNVTDMSTRPKDKTANKKRKFETGKGKVELAPHQTLVFVATKHHVEYISMLLLEAGYAVASIYGSMDQEARRGQLNNFRAGRSNVLVVTDLAARGIDIPILENVVNYDFPAGARNFIHRVGRTARAGRPGWAYSLVTTTELPFLLDLELFLGRPIAACPLKQTSAERIDYSSQLVLGTLPRDRLDQEVEHLASVLLGPSVTLQTLKNVARKGQRMYEKSQPKASAASHRRAKDMSQLGDGLAGAAKEAASMHPVFRVSDAGSAQADEAASRSSLLAALTSFRPAETVFEIGSRGKTPAAQLMRQRRQTLGKSLARRAEQDAQAGALEEEEDDAIDVEDSAPTQPAADEAMIEDVFETAPEKGKSAYADPSFYMGYTQAGAADERGYSMREEPGNFAAQARGVTFDIVDDEANPMAPQRASMLRWDRKNRKFVKGDGTGSDNQKLVKTESGVRLPASFKAGHYDDWRRKQKTSLPRVGDQELPSRNMGGAMRYRHKAGPAKEDSSANDNARPYKGKKRFDVKSDTKTKSSGNRRAGHQNAGKLKTPDQIRKERVQKENRKRRSTQPSKKKR